VNRKILVADDEIRLVEVLRKYLKIRGFDVVTAFNGESCLRVAAKEMPDLILLDINMPQLNGFQVCKALKNNNATKDIPVIMLTALAEEEYLTEALERGASCFISKPFSIIDLGYEIDTVFGWREN
jgi:DNA-binding response OmpR family regulator